MIMNVSKQSGLRRLRILWWPSLVMILSACSVLETTLNKARIILEVQQSIDIPQGHSRVYIQAGRQVQYDKLNELQWYCLLQLRNQQPGPPSGIILPGRFVVTGQWRYRDVVNSNQYRVADRTWLWTQRDASAFTYLWHLELQNIDQPDVKALDCGHFAESGDVQWPGITHLNQILGPIARLKHSGTGVQ